MKQVSIQNYSDSIWFQFFCFQTVAALVLWTVKTGWCCRKWSLGYKSSESTSFRGYEILTLDYPFSMELMSIDRVHQCHMYSVQLWREIRVNVWIPQLHWHLHLRMSAVTSVCRPHSRTMHFVDADQNLKNITNTYSRNYYLRVTFIFNEHLFTPYLKLVLCKYWDS